MANNKPTCPFGTHYHAPTATVFFPGKCETCGEPVEEPNAVGLHNPEDFTLEYVPERLPEIFYNDDTGQCACERCA